MSKSIILILSLFAICYSEGLDYSTMSNAEKILMYDTMKKSPLETALLNHFAPGYGFFMLRDELDDKRLVRNGILINGLKFVSIATAVVLHDIQKAEDQYHSECIASKIEDAIDDYRGYSRYCYENIAPQLLSHISLGIYLGISIFESYYIANKTREYNNRVYKTIFGTERPNFRLSMYPLQNGAGISLTYSFN